MEFTKSLIKGKLIKRYKRFFVDVKLDNQVVTAHCPNTGSMKGLLDEGNEAYLLKNDDPKRKLKYTLQILKAKGNLVGVNTHLANKIVHNGLMENLISELRNNEKIKPEVFFNKETRFDFLAEKNNKKIFIEVKNVTLFRDKKTAEFPDAITTRGAKHLRELSLISKSGLRAVMLYLIQRNDCNFFKIAQDIDTEYAEEFNNALNAGVEVICMDTILSNKAIDIGKNIQLLINK